MEREHPGGRAFHRAGGCLDALAKELPLTIHIQDVDIVRRPESALMSLTTTLKHSRYCTAPTLAPALNSLQFSGTSPTQGFES